MVDAREERLKQAYSRFRQNRESEKDSEDSHQAGDRSIGEGFEPPTTQVEAIFDQVRSMTKRYGILPPPPFLPDFKVPASHREENTDALERLEKLEKVEQLKETPKTRKCPNCTFENVESANFCQRCGEALTEDPQGDQTLKEDWRHKRRNVGLDK